MRERLLIRTLSALLFLLPWQTIWIIQETFLGGIKMEYWTIGFYATEALLWCAVLLFLPWYYEKWKRGPHPPFAWTPDRLFTLSCALFILYCYLSSLWSPNPALALQHAQWILEAFLLFFLLFLGPLSKHRVYTAMAVGSALPAILGITQFLTQSAIGSALFGLSAHPAEAAGASIIDAGNFGRWLRAYGTFPHPNLFGGYLVVAIILTDQLIGKTQRLTSHLSLLILSLLQWTALFFTFSRSAWLAALVWLIISLKPITYNRKVFLYRLSLLSIFAIIFFPLIATRLAGTTVPETRSVNERISGYTEAIALWRTHPFTGNGIGNYTVAARHMFPDRMAWEYQPVHNVPLLLLAELGIIGIILLGAIAGFSIIWNISLLPMRAAIPLLILAFFDHYLVSSHIGLLLNSFF